MVGAIWIDEFRFVVRSTFRWFQRDSIRCVECGVMVKYSDAVEAAPDGGAGPRCRTCAEDGQLAVGMGCECPKGSLPRSADPAQPFG